MAPWRLPLRLLPLALLASALRNETPLASPLAAPLASAPWCAAKPPPPGALAPPPGPKLPLRAVTYNLQWWSLFGRRGGGGAARLLASAHAREPIDFIGFQETDDVARVLREAGLAQSFLAFSAGHAVALALRRDAWDEEARGVVDVAEDSRRQYYGRRVLAWIRATHRASGQRALLAVHHGPLPVGTGGLCGSEATAANLLVRLAEASAGPRHVVLVGDFNAGRASGTARALSRQLQAAAFGAAYGGVDQIWTNSPGALVRADNLGTGGSDHSALAASLSL